MSGEVCICLSIDACNSATPPPAAVCQNGVMDGVPHPVEPPAARLTVAAKV
ncbi:MAG TPA: hypothetical protein VII40_01895 [Xanthobacteraceae bacterium]